MAQRDPPRQLRRLARPYRRSAAALALGAGLVLPACGSLGPLWGSDPETPCPADAEIYRAARQERTAHLEREAARLRTDLRHAEETMVAIESGLRGVQTRADAVSSLAEARIVVERAGQNAPWRRRELEEARAKLDEAERQLQDGHSGSAVFFASRARRIVATLDEEAKRIARNASTRFIRARRANLRAGPSTDDAVVGVLDEATPVFPERQEGKWVLVRTISGSAGWVHGSLLRPR